MGFSKATGVSRNDKCEQDSDANRVAAPITRSLARARVLWPSTAHSAIAYLGRSLGDLAMATNCESDDGSATDPAHLSDVSQVDPT